MSRLGLVALALVSACSVSQKDPCATFTGACLTLVVSGPSGDRVDTIEVKATGAFAGDHASTFTPSNVALPVRLAVVPPAGATGTVTLVVVGNLGSAQVGEWTGMHTLVANDRAVLDLTLAGGTSSDAGIDGDTDGALDGDGSPPDLSTCTESTTLGCSGDDSALLTCDSTGHVVSTACSYGCTTVATQTMSGARCGVFVPHAPADATTIAGAASGDITVSGAVEINTSSGAITNLRTATDPTMSTIQGSIGYQMLGNAGVFTLHSIVFDDTAQVTIKGTASLVIVSATTILVHGVIDARPNGTSLCTGPAGYVSAGGFGGGSSGSGGGGGGGTSGNGGGGGGALADNARAGGPNAFYSAGGTGGFEVAVSYPIVGGSGGGAGSDLALGGTGGGAVHLIAGTSIEVGSMAATSAVGINVSGCGGQGGVTGSGSGGGGSGGTILLEAPMVTLLDHGTLMANGGGGGGSTDGAVSPLAATGNAGGGTSDGTYGAGGQGGGFSLLPGDPGTENTLGGGAGGSAGRIIIFDRAGTITPAATAVISPNLHVTATSGNDAASVGKITTQ